MAAIEIAWPQQYGQLKAPVISMTDRPFQLDGAKARGWRCPGTQGRLDLA